MATELRTVPRGTRPARMFLSGIKAQRLKYERELTGFYITRPSAWRATRRRFTRLPRPRPPALTDCPTASEVKLCGIITTVKSMLTKKGDRMAYVTLEDLHGMVEVIVFPDLFKTVGDLIVPESLIRVTGTDRPRRQRHQDPRAPRSNRWPICKRSPSSAFISG